MNATPERISFLCQQLARQMDGSLKSIDDINRQARLLSFNARIEAAKAGEAGRSFAVVAAEMETLSRKTGSVAENLAQESRASLGELTDISRRLASDVRGQRLSDLALTNIELVDRNLYERSCDVRWWATDPSVVEAAEAPEDQAVLRNTSGRLATILKAYTVYYDIVICDTAGRILVNGKPGEFSSRGASAANNQWFRSAMETISGDEFGFEGVHASPLVGNRRILAYSCAIRPGGEVHGRPIGVMGILFNWDALSQTIVDQTPIAADERLATQVLMVDREGNVLANSRRDRTSSQVSDSVKKILRGSSKRGYETISEGGQDLLICFALAPGYETYTTGWWGLILQDAASIAKNSEHV